jgi:hypothetical protein
MSTLLVRVLFPNQVLENVTVSGTDTPWTLALSGPPLKSPVILLHKGRCLCPYTSLDSQGVTNGDLVVLHPVPASRKVTVAAREPDKPDQVFNEILRLADTAFLPYETSQHGSAAYQQMWQEDEKDEEDEEEIDPPTTIPTRLTAQPDGVSTQPLPTCWDDIATKRKKTETFV